MCRWQDYRRLMPVLRSGKARVSLKRKAGTEDSKLRTYLVILIPLWILRSPNSLRRPLKPTRVFSLLDERTKWQVRRHKR